MKDFPLAGWLEFGLDLGLSFNRLEAIRVDQHYQTKGCFTEMLTAWLRWSDQVLTFGGPTWRQLIETLERKGHANIALTIKQSLAKHKRVGVAPRQDRPGDNY